MTSSPIAPEHRSAARRGIALCRMILAAHRPADLESMRRFDNGRRALAKAVAS